MPIKEPEHFNFMAAAFGLLMAVFGASAKYCSGLIISDIISGGRLTALERMLLCPR